MKKSPGERLCEFVAQKFYGKEFRELNHAMEQVGQRLKQFHSRRSGPKSSLESSKYDEI